MCLCKHPPPFLRYSEKQQWRDKWQFLSDSGNSLLVNQAVCKFLCHKVQCFHIPLQQCQGDLTRGNMLLLVAEQPRREILCIVTIWSSARLKFVLLGLGNSWPQPGDETERCPQLWSFLPRPLPYRAPQRQLSGFKALERKTPTTRTTKQTGFIIT